MKMYSTTRCSRYRYRLLVVLVAVLLPFLAQAEGSYGLPDSLTSHARVSVLVAPPSPDEIYTLYGHAGIRVQDVEQGLDLVFNYGIFSFSDDFVWHFLAGRTDYQVAPQYTNDYLGEYRERPEGVEELLLDLDPMMVQRVWDYLLRAIEPENRVYRYHFFEDNCSTRPVRILLGVLNASRSDGQTYELSQAPSGTTWRREINRLEAQQPWLVLGTDLALGAPADKEMREGDLVFLPDYLGRELSRLHLSGGEVVSIVSERVHHASTKGVTRASLGNWRRVHPMVVGVLFCLVCLLPLLCSMRRRHVGEWLDVAITTVLGILGCALFYIVVLSEHPFVSPNYNLWVLNPLYLAYPASYLLGAWGSRLRLVLYFTIFVGIGIFVLIGLWLPQHFNGVVYLLAIGLLLLSGSRILERHMDRSLPSSI